MRKSQLRRLKRDAEEAWATLKNAAHGPQAARDRYENLPALIDEARERLAAEHYLSRLEEEHAKGLEPKIAQAERRLKKAQNAFDVAEHAMCQYAVFYARQRRDVDLVWTSEDEGNWTLEGTVAGTFDGKARKITMKKLILWLLEPHSNRSDESDDEDEWKRHVKAKEWDKATYRLSANDLYKAMTGLPTNAYVDIAGCTVQVRRLRAYLKLAGDVIEIELPEPALEVDEGKAEHAWGYRETMTTRAWPEGLRSHKATWKHVLEIPEAHIQIAA